MWVFVLLVLVVVAILVARKRLRSARSDGVGAARARWERRCAPVLLALGWTPSVRTIAWAMVDGCLGASMVGVDGPQLPPAVIVGLAPADFNRLGLLGDHVANQVAELTEEVAHRRSWRATGGFEVEVEVDEVARQLAPRVRPTAASGPGPQPARAHHDIRLDPMKPTAEIGTVVDQLQAVLLEVENGERHYVSLGVTTVGRHGKCGIVVDGPRVSRQHVRLIYGPEGLFVEDAGSTNGTTIDKRVLEGRQRLAVGDQIGVGGVTLKVESAPARD